MQPEDEEGGGPVIVIDDDADLLAAQVRGLTIAGFEVTACASASDALVRLSRDHDGAVISDVRMPGMDGLAFLEAAKAVDAEIPVLLLTGHGDVAMAVDALKNGAYDFLTKPFSMDKLVSSLRQAIAKRRLIIENRQLRTLAAQTADGAKTLLGESTIMARLRDTLAQVADADIDLLITGETGTGKETAARALHKLSRRRGRPFVKIGCASIPGDSFQSELFGMEAPPRAAHLPSRRSLGRLERAQRGFVLIDEVEALSLQQQAHLLEVVETRAFWPVGADEPRDLDARIVATSRGDLRAAVEEGRFRADLFYRLSGVSIHLPPLSQRRRDIPLLFQHFVVASCAQFNRPIPRITERVHAFLQTHDWPGNVRELEQFAERFALGIGNAADDGPAIDVGDRSLTELMAAFEADVLRQTLETHRGRASASAKALGLARKTLYDKLSRHQISVAAYRQHGVADDD